MHITAASTPTLQSELRSKLMSTLESRNSHLACCMLHLESGNWATTDRSVKSSAIKCCLSQQVPNCFESTKLAEATKQATRSLNGQTEGGEQWRGDRRIEESRTRAAHDRCNDRSRVGQRDLA